MGHDRRLKTILARVQWIRVLLCLWRVARTLAWVTIAAYRGSESLVKMVQRNKNGTNGQD